MESVTSTFPDSNAAADLAADCTIPTLEAVKFNYREQFHPEGPVENYLVDVLVHSDWMKRRLTRMESNLFAKLASVETLEDDLQTTQALEKVFRMLAALERSYFRALKELRKMQQPQPPKKQFAAPPRKTTEIVQTAAVALVPTAETPVTPPRAPERPSMAAGSTAEPPKKPGTLVFVG